VPDHRHPPPTDPRHHQVERGAQPGQLVSIVRRSARADLSLPVDTDRLKAWYPGQAAGTAIARLLFGDTDPGGRLPVTFPAGDIQGPAATNPARYPGDGTTVRYDEGLLVGYRWYDATGRRPLFPFGFSLSYTTFRYADLGIRTADGGLVVRARVTNTGRRTGTEVVQLYLGFPAAAHEPPRQLRGYRKVILRPGASATVTFTVPPADLSTWDTDRRTVHPGRYGVYVGSSSRTLPLRRSVLLH
jgi:beta-glucosidase